MGLWNTSVWRVVNPASEQTDLGTCPHLEDESQVGHKSSFSTNLVPH